MLLTADSFEIRCKCWITAPTADRYGFGSLATILLSSSTQCVMFSSLAESTAYSLATLHHEIHISSHLTEKKKKKKKKSAYRHTHRMNSGYRSKVNNGWGSSRKYNFNTFAMIFGLISFRLTLLPCFSNASQS